jgi:hypothetical protein
LLIVQSAGNKAPNPSSGLSIRVDHIPEAPVPASPRGPAIMAYEPLVGAVGTTRVVVMIFKRLTSLDGAGEDFSSPVS